MIDFSKCKISFVALAPPNDVLTHFFQAPSDTPVAIFL
jgi:hypothetical protein